MISEDEIYKGDEELKCMDFYKIYSNISLAREIYSFVYYISAKLERNLLLEIPSCHRKTPIIAYLARVLADQ